MVHSKFSFSGLSGQAAIAAIVALMAGSGCQSTQPTTPAPATVPAALEVNVEDPDNPEAAAARPTYPDGYPNFAGSLSAASVQMSNEEALAEYQSRLAELRRLAARHGAETQAQIAN